MSPHAAATLKAFLSQFPNFSYNSLADPRSEFHRLAQHQQWSSGGSSRAYERAYLAFLAALGDEVESGFFWQYRLDGFVYDAAKGPKNEFMRLAETKGWKPEAKEWMEARKTFEECLEKEQKKDKDEVAALQDKFGSLAVSGNGNVSNRNHENKNNGVFEHSDSENSGVSVDLGTAKGATAAVSQGSKGKGKGGGNVKNKEKKGSKDEINNPQPTPVDTFFALNFPDSNYSPQKHLRNEFNRICRARGLNRKTHESIFEMFYAAVEEEFEYQLNFPSKPWTERLKFVDEEDLELKPWKCLSIVLDLPMVRGSKTEFKKAIERTFVNIYDLIHFMRQSSGTNRAALPRTFDGLRALAKFSGRKKRVYPLEFAKQSEILKGLLKPLYRGKRRLMG